MNAGTAWACVMASMITSAAIADTPAAHVSDEIALILDEPLSESKYSEAVRCLSIANYRSVEVLDTGHLLFWGNGGRVWLNQLRTACYGLTNDQILQFRMTGPRVCEMDRFQGLDRYSPGLITSPICSLQRFELITDEQANRLRAALARRQQTPAVVTSSTSEPADE
jgi:Family of unknown function (DUF6491)